MAKRKKTVTRKAPARLPLRVSKHLKALDMNERAYIDWCWDNGFTGSTDKTTQEMETEAAFFEAWLNRYKNLDRVMLLWILAQPSVERV